MYFCGMLKRGFFGLLVIIVLLGVSCSKHSRVLKSGDNELKYEVAIDLFEKGDYYRAIQLFDQLIAIYRGTDRIENH